MSPSKAVAYVLSPILLIAGCLMAKADTNFYIIGAGVNGQEAITFSIPSSSTPDFLSGDNFSFSNVPITLLFGYGPQPPAGTEAPGAVSFSDYGDFQYFSVDARQVVPDVSGQFYSGAPPFFVINDGHVSFLSGQYSFVGIGTGFFMNISADDPPTSPVPEPASIGLISTGALYLLIGQLDRRRRHIGL